MIKIENDQIVDLSGIALEMKKLCCSICYCVLINPKKCSNRKCSKMFCSECIKTAVMNELCCPFCRLSVEEVEFICCDSNINFVLNNLKLICPQKECSSKVFKVDIYIKHIKEKHFNIEEFKEKCQNCNKSDNSKNMKKCLNSECEYYSCRDCNMIKFCVICKLGLCEICITSKQHNCIESKFQSIIGSNFEENLIKCFCCNKYSVNGNNEICKCDKCARTYCKNFPCELFNEFRAKCNCLIQQTEELCIHQTTLKNDNCIPKCCFSNINGTNKCSNCNKFSCSSSFCTSKCCNCLMVFCKDCLASCKLCQTDFCKKCCEACDNCKFSSDNSYSCLKCSKTIGQTLLKKCSYINSDTQIECKLKLCINCWKVCNACSLVLCSEHYIKCMDCEESTCQIHLYNCDYCDNKYSKNKLCLKNCTRKCDICINISTGFCDKESHTFVERLKCGHSVCVKCIRKCAFCAKSNKLNNNFCPVCYQNKLSYCKFCKADYCNDCIRFCNYCGENYCHFNKCINCNKTYNNCTNCLIYNSQVFCSDCEENFSVCINCSNMLICSLFCFVEYSTKTSHLCQMFNCEKCLNYKKVKNLISVEKPVSNHLLSSNLSSSVNRSHSNRPSFVRRFSENFSQVNLIESNDLINLSDSLPSLAKKNRKRRDHDDDKVSTGCNETCACTIY